MPMATKIGMVVTYIEECIFIQSHDPLMTWSCKIMSKLNQYLSYHNGPGHQTWQGGVLLYGAFIHKVMTP